MTGHDKLLQPYMKTNYGSQGKTVWIYDWLHPKSAVDHAVDIKAHLAAITEGQLASSCSNGVDTTRLESSLAGLNLDVSMHRYEARLRQLEDVDRDAQRAAALDRQAAEVAEQCGQLEEAADSSLLLQLAEVAGKHKQAA